MFFLNELKKRENFSNSEKLSLFLFKRRISLFVCSAVIAFAAALMLSCSMGIEYDSAFVTDYKDTSASRSETVVNQNSDYLIMMYLSGDNNLNNCAWRNLIKAQVGLMNVSQEQTVNVVALIDGNSDGGIYGDGQTHLYKLAAYDDRQYNSKTDSVTSLTASKTIEYTNQAGWISNNGNNEVNMADGKTLYNFLAWCNDNFSASKTVLIIQTHGGGPYRETQSSLDEENSSRAICWDDTDGGASYLSTKDESDAISRTFGKIDLLVQDACLMCSIEEVYGLQDSVHYLISSPNITYANTYNYDKIIPFISQCPANDEGLVEIGKRFVDLNKERCQKKTIRQATTSDTDSTCMELSLSLVDCSKKTVLENIKVLTAKLAEAILKESKFSGRELPYIGGKGLNDDSNFYGFTFSASYVYTQDLGVLAYMIANDVNNTGAGKEVRDAAAELFNQLKESSLILYGWSGGKEHEWYYSGDSGYGYDFLKICDEKTPWGISITSSSKYMNLSSYCNWSEFGKENAWGKILK